MQLKGSKTEANLMAHLPVNPARNKYTYFASVAVKKRQQIAAIFEETADNEKNTQSYGRRPSA